jgi:hypothetical protein
MQKVKCQVIRGCGCCTVTDISFGQWTFYSLIILSIHSLIYRATTRYMGAGVTPTAKTTCWTIIVIQVVRILKINTFCSLVVVLCTSFVGIGT